VPSYSFEKHLMKKFDLDNVIIRIFQEQVLQVAAVKGDNKEINL
jgi:hypothetical protein